MSKDTSAEEYLALTDPVKIGIQLQGLDLRTVEITASIHHSRSKKICVN